MSSTESDGRALSSTRRGYDSKWQRARAAYLGAHPFCVFCQLQGRRVIATVVDHVKPHRLGDAINSGDEVAIADARVLFWDRNNWQGLCKTCHDSVKQAQEKSGLVRGCGLDGVPIDGNHHWNVGR